MGRGDEPGSDPRDDASRAADTPSVPGRTHEGQRARRFDALLRQTPLPERIGRYVVLDTLGRGGMGTVLRAFDRELDRPIALKILHEDLDAQYSARLHREAQAMAKLSHPNVVQVYEVGWVQGRTFVAMELVKGHSADQWIKQRPRPDWRACVEVYIQLGEGLAAAHAKGLVHRDFKPGNAIIDHEGRARVLDFGLARRGHEEAPDEPSLDGSAAEDEPLERGALEAPLTRTGAILGTPAYMSLEQMYGREADPRSDQFSFCVSLYQAVYGERPFDGRSLHDLAAAIRAGEIRPAPSDGSVPDALRTALVRGLAAERHDRWPSMKALLEQLRRVVLEHAEPAEALPLLERALSMATTHEVDPSLLATTRFVLARTLWAGPSSQARDPSDDAPATPEQPDEPVEGRTWVHTAGRADAARWDEIFGESDSWLPLGESRTRSRPPPRGDRGRAPADEDGAPEPAPPPGRVIRRAVDLTETADELLYALQRRTGAMSLSEVICRALEAYALIVEQQDE